MTTAIGWRTLKRAGRMGLHLPAEKSLHDPRAASEGGQERGVSPRLAERAGHSD